MASTPDVFVGESDYYPWVLILGIDQMDPPFRDKNVTDRLDLTPG